MKFKQSLLLIVVIIFIYLFIYLNNKNTVYIKSINNGKKYLVYNDDKKYKSVELLAELINRLFKLRKYLYRNINNFPKYKKYIKLLYKNLHPKKTKIYENDINSQYTSYNINKGEEIVFCLRSKKTNKLHDINLLMYVGLHEIAHAACPDVGHTPLFNKIFAFFVEQAIELKLYSKIDFDNKTKEYCGMHLNSSII